MGLCVPSLILFRFDKTCPQAHRAEDNIPMENVFGEEKVIVAFDMNPFVPSLALVCLVLLSTGASSRRQNCNGE